MPRITETEDYIGDGVYVDTPYTGCVVLKANDNQHPTDTITLEIQELRNLFAYVKRIGIVLTLCALLSACGDTSNNVPVFTDDAAKQIDYIKTLVPGGNYCSAAMDAVIAGYGTPTTVYTNRTGNVIVSQTWLYANGVLVTFMFKVLHINTDMLFCPATTTGL